MRYFVPTLLVAAFVMPTSAQEAKFINVEIELHSKMMDNLKKKKELPESIHMRFPLALAKTFLKTLEGNEIKMNGKEKPGLKVDDLMAMLNEFKAGDLLLEVNTSDGDFVRITLE